MWKRYSQKTIQNRPFLNSYSTASKPRQSSVLKPIASVVVLSSTTFLAFTYLSTKNSDLGAWYAENIPNGPTFQNHVLMLEQKIRNTNPTELYESVNQTVNEKSTQINEIKNQTLENLDTVIQTTKELKDKTNQGFNDTMKTIHDTKESVTATVTQVSATVNEKIDQGSQIVNSTFQTVHDTYQSGQDFILGSMDVVEDKFDYVKSVFTGNNPAPRVPRVKKKDSAVDLNNEVIAVKKVDEKPVKLDENVLKTDEKVKVVTKKTENVDTTVVESKPVETPKKIESVPSPVDVVDLKTSQAEGAPAQQINTVEVESDLVEIVVEEASEDVKAKEPKRIVVEPKPKEKEIPTPVLEIHYPVITPPSKESLNSTTLQTLLVSLTDMSEKLRQLSLQTPDSQSISDSAYQIMGLTKYLSQLETEESERLSKILQSQSEAFHASLNELKEDAEKALADTSARLTSSFATQIAEERVKSQALHQQTLTTKLSEQADLFVDALESELARQSKELDAYWNDQVRIVLDNERDGRLARLDHLALTLKQLQKISFDSSDALKRSTEIHQLQSSVRALKLKLNESKSSSFRNELELLKETGKHDEFINVCLQSIDGHGQDYLTFKELEIMFDEIKKPISESQLVPDQAGPLSYLLSVGLSKLLVPKTGLVPGSDVESILSRSKYYLTQHDLDSACREINQLKGWSRKLADDWLVQCRKHLEIQQAVELIETRLFLMQLNRL
ncbi:mitochondrial inner membrane protein Mitofilin [Globomyces pollinis-pini]|nr:mitochondrial inner membrane protein Mitofilin [Globomyces pollinis-pini]